MKKNIIIFGGQGLIGQSLVDSQILKSKYNIISVDLKKKNKSKNSYQFDLRKYEKLNILVKSIEKKYGKIYSIVNCVYPPLLQTKKILDVKVKLLCDEISEHLGIYFNINKEFTDYFLKKKINGKIINFSSIYSSFIPRFEIYHRTNMTMPIQYMLIKNSINNMTKFFSKYFIKKNLHYFTISPGGVFNNQDKVFLKNYKKFSKNGMLNKYDLDGLIEFLLSDKSKKLKGTNFIIDDGFTL